MLKTSLPRSITLPDGTVLDKRISVISGTRHNKGWAINAIRSRGGRYRCVEVLERNLRGKNDLRGRPYQPSTWILTDTKIPYEPQTPHAE